MPSVHDTFALLRPCIHYCVHMAYPAEVRFCSFVRLYSLPISSFIPCYQMSRRIYTIFEAYLEDGGLVGAMLWGSGPSGQDLKDDLRGRDMW